MQIAQKYARAARSSNLRCDDKHSDTDALMAVALCGVDIGPLLLRVKMVNDVGALHELKRGWVDACAKTAFIKSWPEIVSVKRVAAASIEYWLNDICPVCTGKKSDQIDNTPCLTGVDCEACSGTGKRPIPADRDHEPFVRAMAYTLDGIVLDAIGRSRDKLKND